MNEEHIQDIDLENNDTQADTQVDAEVEQINWQAEAAKQRAIAERLKKKLATPKQETATPKLDEEVNTRISKLETLELKRQFGFDNNLSPEETDYVFQFSQGRPTKDTLDHPFIKAGLEALRQAKTVEENTPVASRSSQTFRDESGEFKQDEHKKSFEERSKKILRR